MLFTQIKSLCETLQSVTSGSSQSAVISLTDTQRGSFLEGNPRPAKDRASLIILVKNNGHKFLFLLETTEKAAQLQNRKSCCGANVFNVVSHHK